MIRRLLTLLTGTRCSACGDRIHPDRISLHWHIEHAGELQ